jgi:ribosome biogenesis GTPase / thiamine phosphate phosphatase
MKKTEPALWGADRKVCDDAAQYPEYTLGRILSQEKDLYRMITAEGEYLAKVSGKFRYQAAHPSDFPAVGDFVMAGGIGKGTQAVIHQVLPRKSVFMRKAAGSDRKEQLVATNIDIVFLCMALNQDFNVRRLERYLSIAWDSGAKPVVVLTKSDICEDIEEKLPYLSAGTTAAFLGSSGVGKSTLVNRLLGEERLATGDIRNDDKGRHTTTHRELLFLPDGGMVIDTPGMRELGMWDAKSGIDRTFSDIEELALQCRFRDCTHTVESGCAVQKALKNGTLSKERMQSYQKLKTENDYMEHAKSYLEVKEKKFKEIAKYNKNHYKKQRKNGIYSQ